jgi:flagellar hook-associated protein 1
VAGNALLVTGTDHQDLSTRYSGDNGALEIVAEISHGNPANVITDRIKGGSMGGLIGARDGLIVETRQHMNELAYGIAQEVNQAHRLGFDRRNQQGGDFFENVDGVAGAAGQIKLNREIANDVNRIAAASRTNAPGDNNVANVIANIQYATIFKDGTASLDDAYNSVVGEMGVRAADANHAQETQGNLLQQMQTLRESVSGVSLDEEATKMIEFQKTFDASARLIRTADEMFDTVLSLKRM